MVVADDTADPVHVAADLISEAEHGPDSPSCWSPRRRRWPTPSRRRSRASCHCLDRQSEIVTALSRGTIVQVDTVAEALAFADEYAPEHLSVLVEDDAAALRSLRHAGSLFLGGYSPGSGGRLRHGLQPRAADRPAWRVPTVRCRSRHSGAGCRSSASAGRASPPSATASPWSRMRRASPPTDAPWTSASTTNHTAPEIDLMAARRPRRRRSQVYTWEPSSQVLAARYGLQPSDILRFDLNTSPLPAPDLAAALAGPFDPPLNEYPDSMYTDVTSAAAAYVGVRPDASSSGAGADEVLDIIAKTFLPAGGRAVVPIPTYSMYGVLTTQRGATLDAVPRLGRGPGLWHRPGRTLPRLSGANRGLAVRPQQPDRRARAAGVIEQVLDAAAALGAGGRWSWSTRRMRSSPTRPRSRSSTVSGAHRGPDRVQGLRPRRHAGRLCHRAASDHRAARAPAPARQHLHGLGRGRRGGPSRPGHRPTQRRRPVRRA